MSDPTSPQPGEVGLPGYTEPGSPTSSAPPLPDAPQPQASAPEQPEQVEQAVPAGDQASDEPEVPFQAEAQVQDGLHDGLASMTHEQRAQLRQALGDFDAGDRPPVAETHPSQSGPKLKNMPAGARLNAFIYLLDENNEMKAFGPQDDVPEWARKKIHNEKAWTPPEQTAEERAAAEPASFSKQDLYGMDKDVLVQMAEREGLYVGEEASQQELVDAILSTKR